MRGFWIPLFFLYGLSDDEMVWLIFSSLTEPLTNKPRLIIYSPIASIVRLITASFIYYVGTNFILQYSGSALDPSLLLPAWICIAAVSLLSRKPRDRLLTTSRYSLQYTCPCTIGQPSSAKGITQCMSSVQPLSLQCAFFWRLCT